MAAVVASNAKWRIMKCPPLNRWIPNDHSWSQGTFRAFTENGDRPENFSKKGDRGAAARRESELLARMWPGRRRKRVPPAPNWCGGYAAFDLSEGEGQAE